MIHLKRLIYGSLFINIITSVLYLLVILYERYPEFIMYGIFVILFLGFAYIIGGLLIESRYEPDPYELDPDNYYYEDDY